MAHDTYLREASAIVARSTLPGNAKASSSENGQPMMALTLFSFLSISDIEG